MSNSDYLYDTQFSARSASKEWMSWFVALTIIMGILIISIFFGGSFFGINSDLFIYMILFVSAVVTIYKSYSDAVFLTEENELATEQAKNLVKINDIEKFIEESKESIFKNHIENLYTILLKHDQIDQDNLISFLSEKLHSRNRVVELFSSILITIGLIGTIMGLIIMVTKLRLSLGDFNAEKSDEFISSLMGSGGALSGLDTAFYTTLIGAITGGVILRILSSIVDSHITRYVAHIAELTEKLVLPQMRNTAKNIPEYYRNLQ